MEEIGRGLVFDIQRYSLHDGPGIRTMVFLQGCPLACLWCHSPESQSVSGHIAYLPLLCIGGEDCGECLEVCKHSALKKGPKKFSRFIKKEIQVVELNRENCTQCGACAQVCFPKALYFTAKERSLEEVLSVIEKDRNFYDKSEGGVTLSGGEPMVQREFTEAILKECKRRGIHTALDTSGCVEWSGYEKVLPYVDLVLYDLKVVDEEKSKDLIGFSSKMILNNLRKISTMNIPIQVRFAVIPGLNDDEQNISSVVNICKELGTALTKVQILPYHKLGMSKYERIGLEYKLPSIEPPNNETIEVIRQKFEKLGLVAVIG